MPATMPIADDAIIILLNLLQYSIAMFCGMVSSDIINITPTNLMDSTMQTEMKNIMTYSISCTG